MSVLFQTTEITEQTVNKDDVHQDAIKGDVALLQRFKEGMDLNSKDSEDTTLLNVATKAEQVEVVEFSLNHQRSEVECENNEQVTNLHYGRKSGEENIVNELLKGSTSIDLQDFDRLTELHYACKGDLLKSEHTLRESGSHPNNTDITGGFEQIATHLTLSGVDINKQYNDGRTSLHYACRISKTQLVEDLLKSGADVHIEDLYGFTALHSACEHGCLSTVQLLISAGSDINKTVNDGRTSLHIACSRGHRDVAAFLIKLRADEEFEDVHARFSGDHITMDRRLDINKQCCEGRTSLHYACCSNNTLLVKDLLETGADVDVEDHDGYTALHTACRYECLSTIKVLIHWGSDMHKRDKCGRTALHNASEIGSYDTAALLIKSVKSLDEESQDKYTDTFSDETLFVMDVSVIRKEYVNKQCATGCTPLHYACLRFNTRLVEILLQSGADVHKEDFDGSTALHWACAYGCVSTVSLLLRYGSDIQKIDKDGRTALLVAQSFGHSNIESLLIKSGGK